jgi:polyhydroxyalkanoate synthesis regulator phasin
MRLPRTLVTFTAAGVLTLGGVGVATTIVAPMASAVTVADADTTAERVQALTDALTDLVTGGTLTQEQSDTVAATLADSDALRDGGHHGGRLLDLEVAATALGLTEDDLRTALEADGATLTTVADAQGVEVPALSDALTAAATDRIEQQVADGDLTQDEADETLAALPDRIAALLTDEIADRHGRRGDDEGDQATDAEATGSGAGA